MALVEAENMEHSMEEVTHQLDVFASGGRGCMHESKEFYL